ncbi:hypothetical protein SAMN04490196_0086 [Pseudomonas moraviensis]|nr:hypothetical protein SAMN04490196_0086 [Pseudomonas moraviensis]
MSAAWPDEISALERLVSGAKRHGISEDSVAFIRSRYEMLGLMVEAYQKALDEIEKIETTSATTACR